MVAFGKWKLKERCHNISTLPKNATGDCLYLLVTRYFVRAASYFQAIKTIFQNNVVTPSI